MSEITLSSEQIEQFQEDGAILLKGIFDKKWVDLAASAIKKTMDNPSPFSEMLRPNQNEGWSDSNSAHIS